MLGKQQTLRQPEWYIEIKYLILTASLMSTYTCVKLEFEITIHASEWANIELYIAPRKVAPMCYGQTVKMGLQ